MFDPRGSRAKQRGWARPAPEVKLPGATGYGSILMVVRRLHGIS